MLNSTYLKWTVGENVNQQPDVTILVGNTQQQAVKFLAHKFVLSSHSSYFKTLFSSYAGAETRVYNIGSQTFAHLLSFMYTGHLELNPFNVYEVFVASNLLHMTQALKLCEQYLLPQRRSHVTTGGWPSAVVKPIARRSVTTAPAENAQQRRILKYQPLRLHNESSSVFKPVGSEAADGRAAGSKGSQPPVQTANDENRVVQMQPTHRESDRRCGTPHVPSNEAVLDIACCDGPIRFHRVTNQFYDPNKAMTTSPNTDVESDTNLSPCRGWKQIFQNDIPLQFDLTESQPLNNPAISSADAKYKKKNDHLQFYPCKTCGSKFPSYYFVHKHRKLHHREADELFNQCENGYRAT